jgi:hypothetical protein
MSGATTTMESRGLETSTSLDLATGRCLMRKPRLRMWAEAKESRLARHLTRGNMRRSSGRRVVVAMVEQLVPLLNISHTATRGGAWCGSGHDGAEPNRSAAASTTSGAEEEEACERERRRSENVSQQSVLYLYVVRRSTMDNDSAFASSVREDFSEL